MLDFDEQKLQFPNYDTRPYEIAAKTLATEIMGYEPEHRDVILVREERTDILYDRIRPVD